MKKYLSELIATFILVFVGTGAIVVDAGMGGQLTHLGVSLVFGLVVMCMIYSVGDVSGAHLNPAVTIAFWVAKRIPGKEVAPYVFCQCLGAILASLFIWYLFPEAKDLGRTFPKGEFSNTQAFVLELVLSAILMFVILNVSTGAKEKGLMAGLTVGGVIALEALFAGPLTGASMNPARSLGPALVEQNFQDIWIYITAPIIGTVLAVPWCACTRDKDCCAS